MSEKKPMYKKPWFIVLVALILVGYAASAVTGNSSEETQVSEETQLPEPEVTETPAAETTPEPAESASNSPLSDPNSDESIAYFVMSSTGQFIDIDKDVDDAIKRAKADQSLRLLGNILEFSFNFGQLDALDAPDAVSKEWAAALLKLEAQIDATSDLGTKFVSGEASTSQVVGALEKIRGHVNSLAKIVAKVG